MWAWEEFELFIIVTMKNSLLLLCKSHLVYDRVATKWEIAINQNKSFKENIYDQSNQTAKLSG